MHCEHESRFRNRLMDLLAGARLNPVRELRFRPLAETRRGELRCDIAIPRPSGEGYAAVIECKLDFDPQALCTALGQARVYQEVFGADHAVLCFPWSVEIPDYFERACAKSGIKIAKGNGILEALADLGVLDPLVAAIHALRDCLSGINLSELSLKQLDRLHEALGPIFAIYEECGRVLAELAGRDITDAED